MSEPERESDGPEPPPAVAAVPGDVTPPVHGGPAPHDDLPAPHDDAPASSGPALEQPPVWDDPNESDSEAYPEHSHDPWAFLQDAAGELNEPPEATPRFTPAAPERALEDALERTLVSGLFRPNIADLLGMVERTLRALPRAKPTVRLLEFVSRARAAQVPEPRLFEPLLGVHAAGRVADDFGLLAALLSRRLALPSLHARRRASAPSERQRLLREVRALARRVSRARGDEGVRELARLSTQLGERASERGVSLDELAPLLRRRVERAATRSARAIHEVESSDAKRSRRFRLPGRVEIVIYEE